MAPDSRLFPFHPGPGVEIPSSTSMPSDINSSSCLPFPFSADSSTYATYRNRQSTNCSGHFHKTKPSLSISSSTSSISLVFPAHLTTTSESSQRSTSAAQLSFQHSPSSATNTGTNWSGTISRNPQYAAPPSKSSCNQDYSADSSDFSTHSVPTDMLKSQSSNPGNNVSATSFEHPCSLSITCPLSQPPNYVRKDNLSISNDCIACDHCYDKSASVRTDFCTMKFANALASTSFIARNNLASFISYPSSYFSSCKTTRKRFVPSWSLWQVILLMAVCLPKEVQSGPNERRLLHDLLDNYNQLERPVYNESDPVQVSFGITLQQIIDVDEKNQLLITNTWLKLEWNDVNLQWNESDYGGVKDLRIPPYKIWKPDVLMYNSADEGFDGTYQTKVVVYSSGSCLYIPPGIFKSTCKIDITWFPFDDQKCKMKFGSWTYSGWQLDLQLKDEKGGDLSDFIKNGEWDLIGCPGKRNVVFYECCPEPYVDVTFEIIIRRRTLYYFCNLILPCVLIASMAVLGFTLPPDCGEKLSLALASFLSWCVVTVLLNNGLPIASNQVPLIGTYFNCIMFMVASSVVSTVLILNYHHRSANTHEMSPMIRSMFLQWLPWVLRMHRPGEKITRKTIMLNNKMKELELKERSSKSLLANVLDIDDDFRAHTLPHPGHNSNSTAAAAAAAAGFIRLPHAGHSVDDSALVHTCMSQCTRELNLILKEIRHITDKMKKDNEDEEVTSDWRFAAMVVDRMCLIVFTLFTITATVAVLLSAPHIMVP